jgi:hypothetical protein
MGNFRAHFRVLLRLRRNIAPGRSIAINRGGQSHSRRENSEAGSHFPGASKSCGDLFPGLRIRVRSRTPVRQPV